MTTEINTSITRQVLPIDPDDFGDYYVEIVTISAPLHASRYSDVKAAFEEIEYRKTSDVWIPTPYSDYDCTGKPFTRHLERLTRFVIGNAVHYVYKHSVSIDC